MIQQVATPSILNSDWTAKRISQIFRSTPCPVSRWLSKFGAQNGAPGSKKKQMPKIGSCQSCGESWHSRCCPRKALEAWKRRVFRLRSQRRVYDLGVFIMFTLWFQSIPFSKERWPNLIIYYIYNIYIYISRCLNIWNVPLDPLHQNLPKASMYSVRPVLKTPDNLTSSAEIIRTPLAVRPLEWSFHVLYNVHR